MLHFWCLAADALHDFPEVLRLAAVLHHLSALMHRKRTLQAESAVIAVYTASATCNRVLQLLPYRLAGELLDWWEGLIAGSNCRRSVLHCRLTPRALLCVFNHSCLVFALHADHSRLLQAQASGGACAHCC
jgi:non-ribosomal peptide synthetase component F